MAPSFPMGPMGKGFIAVCQRRLQRRAKQGESDNDLDVMRIDGVLWEK